MAEEVMNTTQTQNEANSDQARIAQAAYYLWQEGGCQSGRDVEYWLLAEKQLQTVSPQPIQAVKVRPKPGSVTPTLRSRKPPKVRSNRLRRDFAAYD